VTSEHGYDLERIDLEVVDEIAVDEVARAQEAPTRVEARSHPVWVLQE